MDVVMSNFKLIKPPTTITSYKTLKRIATKTTKITSKQQDAARHGAYKHLGLQTPKHSLIKVEKAKWRGKEARRKGKTLHHRKRRPSSASNNDELLHSASRSSPKRPLPSRPGSRALYRQTLEHSPLGLELQ
jgi:hypothetical protein